VEKVDYVLWRPPGTTSEAFAEALLGPVADDLLRAGARGLQVNVADEAVAGALMALVHTDPQMEAVVGVWVDSAAAGLRRPIDAAVAGAGRFAAYLVTESEPLPDAAPPPLRERTRGFANLAFLRRPGDLDPATWLSRWQDDHTPVAIETQSTFRYVQDVVVRPLTAGAPAVDGIVEECFPIEALTDLHAFFAAAPGDDDRLGRNLGRMNESVHRFGADRSIDVVPTSEYVVRRPAVP
jgi:EthD domain